MLAEMAVMVLTCRPSVALTVVGSDRLLLAGLGSPCFAAMLAVMVFVPPAPGVPTTVVVWVLKAVCWDQLQVTMPGVDSEQVPLLLVLDETYVDEAGRLIVRTGLVAREFVALYV